MYIPWGGVELSPIFVQKTVVGCQKGNILTFLGHVYMKSLNSAVAPPPTTVKIFIYRMNHTFCTFQLTRGMLGFQAAPSGQKQELSLISGEGIGVERIFRVLPADFFRFSLSY